MDPLSLHATLSDLSSGNVTTGVTWYLASLPSWTDAAKAYELPLIEAVAAADLPDQVKLKHALKAKFARDFNVTDWMSMVRSAKVRLGEALAPDNHEPAQVIRDGNGKVLAGLQNATLFFQSAKEWQGVVGLNEFTGGLELRKQPPAPVTQRVGDELEDVFDTDATRWLEIRSKMLWRRGDIHCVIDSMADKARFHPVREYFTSLYPSGLSCPTCPPGTCPWDGVERLSTWLFAYCGVDPGSDTKPNTYAANIGRRFLISMAARILKPGCKADHMLVLEGKTGRGKSSVARALCPDERWFTDQIGDMGSKDASMNVRGIWVVELAELDALSKADEKTAKRFISQQFERFRLPYGRRVAKFDRQCVFIGTTERSDWMRSETGRRFWPVATRHIDYEAVARDRDLLWAEALHCFRAGERWHLAGAEEIEEATTEQRKRYAEDIWRDEVIKISEKHTMIEDWIPTSVIVKEMGIPFSQQDDRTRHRIGSILRTEGWEKVQRRVGGRAERGYRKAEEE